MPVRGFALCRVENFKFWTENLSVRGLNNIFLVIGTMLLFRIWVRGLEVRIKLSTTRGTHGYNYVRPGPRATP